VPDVSRDVPLWIAKVRTSLENERGAGVVVAVSGGSDSVGLLRVLHRLAPEFDLHLSVAHLNHGIRAEAADADARFVAGLADAFGLPFDNGRWTPERTGHFEADARRARYTWLIDVATQRNASIVAVGHTKDDQAETILHHILRGTGLRGLAGMASRRSLAPEVALLRPLLNASRKEIRAYLDAIGQKYHEDATNNDLCRTRARIRHDLLPKLVAEYNPKVSDALLRLGNLAGRRARGIRRQTRRTLRNVGASIHPERIAFRREPLESLTLEDRAELIRRAWQIARWPEGEMTADRWLRLASVDSAFRGRFSIGNGVDAWISDDLFELAPITSPPKSARHSSTRLPIPGSVEWRHGRVVATRSLEDPHDELINSAALDALIDDHDQPYLLVDSPAAGDRFEPLGMGGQSMPLNDFFRGRHVAKEQRINTPIVRDQRGIVWVVGHRIAHRVRRTEATQSLLALRWDGDQASTRL
jgi:tRNA(Ile)-lysidine synthase